jgi:hypothetical protein
MNVVVYEIDMYKRETARGWIIILFKLKAVLWGIKTKFVLHRKHIISPLQTQAV